MSSLLLLLVITPMLVSSESSEEAVTQAPQPSAPFLVSLRQTSEDKKGPYCAGTIISPRAILTSAYCLQRFEEEQPLELLKVVVGTNELDSGESYGIEKLVIHENYYNEDNNTIHDVAIIFTDEEIQFSDEVLPVLMRDTPVEDEEELRAFGWRSADESLSNELLEVEVIVVINDECGQAGLICALPPVPVSEESLCEGVSGGPLVDLKGGLVGILISGVGTCDTGYPNLYTSVQAYLPWIEKNLVGDYINRHYLYVKDNSDEDGDDDDEQGEDASTTDN
ncbi:chymotrypsin-1-like [Aricia agestis]|uniref:chymotrypsin-1-like n=1 Tax=Aricia agestis TaxID=91739 RepID=UPI001C20A2F6|nr:chymotrypsin-1-like [Aricia agestis]